MKTCTIGIAGPFEEPYLEEWISWHKMIGFDDIVIVTNNWSLPKHL